ncbi:MAG: helicase-related protein, partial [Coprobacillaceae bacterium]
YEGCINYLKCFGLVKNKTQFMREFAQVNTYKGYPEIEYWKNEKKILSMLNSISRPLKKTDILELPEQTFKSVNFKPSKDYNIIKKDRALNGEVFDNQMSYMHGLRQNTSLEAKVSWLVDFLDGTNENVIIFTNYNKEVELINDSIKNKDIYTCVGSEKNLPKTSDINNTVTIVNYTAGSEGIELVYGTICIFFSPTYSYIQYTQAISRIHRIGQNKKTLYYKLVTRNTIEDDIYKALENKQDFNYKIWEEK